MQKLQSDYDALQSEKANTEKYNLALQEQVKEFALSAVAERSEKKERIDKHAAVQKDYVAAIKKLYLSVGIAIVLLAATGLLSRLYFTP